MRIESKDLNGNGEQYYAKKFSYGNQSCRAQYPLYKPERF
jgi:hypothetical protein